MNRKILCFLFALMGIVSLYEVKGQYFLPQKPDSERLKQDLVGRKISQMSDSYFPSGWYLIIVNEKEIANIQILSSSFDDGILLYELNVFVKDESVVYKATVDFAYNLTDKYKWEADYLNTRDIIIVPSGRYDNCIIANIIGWRGEYQLELKNSSDAKFIVGGVVHYEFGDGKWKRFSALIDGYETVTLGGLFFGSIDDYKIHFVEKY